jgi:hypothetical protein
MTAPFPAPLHFCAYCGHGNSGVSLFWCSPDCMERWQANHTTPHEKWPAVGHNQSGPATASAVVREALPWLDARAEPSCATQRYRRAQRDAERDYHDRGTG